MTIESTLPGAREAAVKKESMEEQRGDVAKYRLVRATRQEKKSGNIIKLSKS